MKKDYSIYLKGIGRPAKSVSILEIGAVHSPIFRELPARKSNKIIYRSIFLPSTGGYSSRDQYHANAQEILFDEKCEEENRALSFPNPKDSSRINALSFEWNAADIPYPFKRNSFDEVHCHMITNTVIDPGYCPSLPNPEAYTSELARITKPHGRYFLSVQKGYFIDTCEVRSLDDTLVGLMERFANALKSNGFTPEVIDYDGNYGEEVSRIIRSQRGEVSPFRMKLFTDHPSCVNAFLIARRNSK